MEKMKPYTRECECCWHKITAYTHKLDHSYIDWLIKLVDYRHSHYESAKTSQLWLTNQQYSTFHRLKFRWLAETENNRRKPTTYWILFSEWNVTAYEMIANMWKQVLPIDHEFRILRGKTPQKKYIYELCDDYAYKKREEYQSEKGFSSQRLFT